MRKLWAALIVIFLLAVLLLTTSGAFLIVNDPTKCDVIVVLAGETNRRPTRGLELMQQGYAPRLLLDVPEAAKVFDLDMTGIAQSYVDKLPGHEGISVCPISGLSTKAEAQDVGRCLQKTSAKRVLLVTSDYHTRRALSTFRRELPDHEFVVAAAFDTTQFGASWWSRRQWAKVNFDEWMRLMWWNAVDRWRQ